MRFFICLFIYLFYFFCDKHEQAIEITRPPSERKEEEHLYGGLGIFWLLMKSDNANQVKMN